jgi:hypothetical protein
VACLQTSVPEYFVLTPPNINVNTKICISKIYLLFHTTVKGRTHFKGRTDIKVVREELLKEIFESKGRMKEKEGKNCDTVYTISQSYKIVRGGGCCNLNQ